MLTAIRHGDTALVKIDKLPDWLTKSKTRIFLAGKNNNHEISKGDLYITKDPNTLRDNEFHYGYLVAKDTKLLHTEHSKSGASIPDWIYELFKQKENINWNFRIVLD